MYIYIYSDILSDILSGICSDILSDILHGILFGIFSFSGIHSGILSGIKFGILAWVRVQAHSTASWAGDFEFGSRHNPLHPQRVIWSSGPGMAHCIRSWQRRWRGKGGGGGGGREGEGVAPLLKVLESRDPHLAGEEQDKRNRQMPTCVMVSAILYWRWIIPIKSACCPIVCWQLEGLGKDVPSCSHHFVQTFLAKHMGKIIGLPQTMASFCPHE